MPKRTYDHGALATYYSMLADEFLQSYFVLGLNRVRMHARYFVMAHCLELSFKASLANRRVDINYGTHDLTYLELQLLKQGDMCLDAHRPEPAAQEVFDRMFHRHVSNFIMQDWLDHQEALELLLCYTHIANLKYGMDKEGQNILAVTPSTAIMNRRFLAYVGCARRHFPERGEVGRAVLDFVAAVEREYPEHFKGASALVA